MTKQVDRFHYDFNTYVDKSRFMSYYYQYKLIDRLQPHSILEVGTGRSVLSGFLDRDTPYTRLDIALDLAPDILGDVRSLPFKENSFDLVACFQVLEHLPFDEFSRTLRELGRVARRYLAISLPNACHQFSLQMKIPGLPKFIGSITIPRFYQAPHFDGQHHWELGQRGYSLKKVKKTIAGIHQIVDTFAPEENPAHRFFLLDVTR